MKEDLADQRWRLANLYSCRGEGMPPRMLKFRARAEQQMLYDHLLTKPHVPAYIIKSRRLGISTAIDVLMADMAVFKKSFRGIILDQKQEDATKKMVEIVRYAVDSLPARILQEIHFDKRNDSELRLRWKNEDENEDSVIFATTGARGGDCSMLHVSEWGPIAATDPVRSAEIRSGALPAARLGMRVVETTWMGGRHGDLWDLVSPILDKDPNAEGIIYFFPWHGDPVAVQTWGMVPADLESYFRDLASLLGKTFSQDQKKWYAAKCIEQGIFVRREYPSTLDEAFSAPVKGAIYGEALARMLAEGRHTTFPINENAPVHTCWDLGSPLNMVVWYFQIVGREIRLVDVDISTKKKPYTPTTAERVADMRSKGYALGAHFMPHDANQTERSGKTFKGEAESAGLTGIKVVPRTDNIWRGINYLTGMFNTLHFRVCPAVDEAVSRLNAYRTNPDAKSGATADEPLHDNFASHVADSLRTMAEAFAAGLIKDNGAVPGLLGAGQRGGESLRDHKPRARVLSGVSWQK